MMYGVLTNSNPEGVSVFVARCFSAGSGVEMILIGMRDTFAANFYHFIWTTKKREPMILPEFEILLKSHIRQRCKEKRVICHALDGIPDHMHLVCEIPPALSCADVMHHIKGGSSHFINTREEQWFLDWQIGYGVLTFSRKELPAVVSYVESQKWRHYHDKLWPSLERLPSEAEDS